MPTIEEIRQMLEKAHVASWDNRQLITVLIDKIEELQNRIEELERDEQKT